LLNELHGTVRVATSGPSENSGDGSGELAPHESFLMATRYHPRLNWHTLATWEPVDGSSIEAVRAEIQSGIANPAPPRNPGAPELPVPAATAGAVDPAQPRAVIPSGAEVSDTPGGGDGPEAEQPMTGPSQGGLRRRRVRSVPLVTYRDTRVVDPLPTEHFRRICAARRTVSDLVAMV